MTEVGLIRQLACKKLWDLDLHMNVDVFVEFFLKYPGICKDFYANPEHKKLHYWRPLRNIAPCITDDFVIYKIGKYNAGRVKWLPTNVSTSAGEWNFNIFGDYETKCIPCPDGRRGCEVCHMSVDITFNEEHNEIRKKFNTTKWKYADLLKLWEALYDEKMKILVENKYEKYFAEKLENKFVCSADSMGELEENIKKEIDEIIKDLRSKGTYVI